MNFFRHASIQQKQMHIILGICSLALLLASAGFAIYEALSHRKDMASFLLVRCDVLGRTCWGALDFKDPKAAEENLNALRADPRMISATVFTADGKFFARYSRKGAATPAPSLVSTNAVTAFEHGQLRAAWPIMRAREQLGFIVLESDLEALYTAIKYQAGIAALVFTLAITLAYFLSSRLQRLISGPILGLLETTRAVATGRNYALRARKESADELGQLVDGFNDMLQQVQSRDAELLQAQNFLEKRVEDRTEELQLEVAERRRSEHSVLESKRFLQSTLDALSAHIAILDESGVIVSVNAAWNRFARDNEHAVTGLAAGGNYLQVCKQSPGECAEEAPAVARGIRAVMAGELEEFRLEYPCHSPKEKSWFIVRVTRFGAEGARRIVIAHENITERKQAEDKMAELSSQLIATSRQAGMAEIATGVLHNVGNVLNSVNVSANLVSDQVRKAPVADLGRVVALLREQGANLGAFFTSDPRGPKVAEFLAQVAEKFTRQQESQLAEVAALQKNIEHIKDIVAMQQSYAKVSGLMEDLSPVALIEDALRMNAGSFQKHEVELVRELAAGLPRVCVDKHKVLQILVNLLRNAKHACEEAGHEDKRITVRATQESGRVRVSISDNGVGIPPENLNRIFNHGFTTKKEGHGFGLHSAANAAKEMRGALTVRSDGPGCGATFTLELPVEAQRGLESPPLDLTKDRTGMDSTTQDATLINET